MASVCGFLPVAYAPQTGARLRATRCNDAHPLHALRYGVEGREMVMRIQMFRKLVQWIREEFEDAPDLRMTVNEAARFFALDLATCERVLTELLMGGFLSKDTDQRYRYMLGHS